MPSKASGARDFRIEVSINLSVDELVRPDLVAFPDQLLNEYRVPAYTTVLEVIESKLVDDVNTVLAGLTRLRLEGFGLFLYDFGTGFSTMEQLRRFPFSELKIDLAFLNAARRRASAKAIFHSSVNLVNALSMVPVAEGVEDDADLDLAVELGIHLIQGYHIAKLIRAKATNRRALSSMFSLIFSLKFSLMLSLVCWGNCESTPRCLERQKPERF